LNLHQSPSFERDGSDRSAIAVCLSMLARLRYVNERYREAEQLQRRAISNHEAAGDEMSLAKELDHLGATLAMRAQSEQRSDLAAALDTDTCLGLLPGCRFHRCDSSCWSASDTGGSVCLAQVHTPAPTPNATGVNFDPTFRYQFADVLVGKRVAKIPTHT
jgi:hypothetical protein